MPGFTYNGAITLSCSVRNLQDSVGWFKKVLGFEEVFSAPEVGWAEVASPAAGVTVGLAQNEEVDGRGGTTPVFGVTDIAVARAELESKGVRFDGETQEIPGMVKLATFFDPDGNTYMLSESLGSPS
ncbi:MAG: VOC family protein [Gammaproteobacteria bacterium]|jgi:catechol 2,3-dioxygenase-like lactoylglutathione lyase family enzyme